jgi:photosystem II stability/assembly factor-like uncharacterized protein
MPGSAGPWSESYYSVGKTHVTCAGLRATTDAGRTWRPLPLPNIVIGDDNSRGVAHITFADQIHGWLWGGAFYSTSDAGKTWTQDTSVTHDGATWGEAIPLKVASPFLEGRLSPPIFADALHGWAVAAPCVGIFRTDDGRLTWELVTLPK